MEMVYKMATVGCMEDNSSKDSDESSDRNEANLSEMCKKNGVHRFFCHSENSSDMADLKLPKTDKHFRANGANTKHIPFAKPSIPTLRSRKDRHTPEPDCVRRKRRSARLEKHESANSMCLSPDSGISGCSTTDEADSGDTKTTDLSELHTSLLNACARAELFQNDSHLPNNNIGHSGHKPHHLVPESRPPSVEISATPCLNSSIDYKHAALSGKSQLCTYTKAGLLNSRARNPTPECKAMCNSRLDDHLGVGSKLGHFLNQMNHSPDAQLNNNKSIVIPDPKLNPFTFNTDYKACTNSAAKVSPQDSIATPDTSRSCTPSSIGGPFQFATPTKGTHCECKESSRVSCKWETCNASLDPCFLLEHIRTTHVEKQNQNETFVCLWEGCKVHSKRSCSMLWLERHILCHSGDKPFRCIVDGCYMRFSSQSALHRHVNGHFNASQTANPRTTKSREDTPTKSWKKRKLRRKRPVLVRTGDFFDSGIMDHLQSELNRFVDKTDMDVTGNNNSVTFHGTVIAKKTEVCGKVKVLLHWSPEDVLPDSWAPESQVSELQKQIIPLTSLPKDTVANLDSSLYRRHRFRRHRRK